MQLVFATNNQNKIKEIKLALGKSFDVLSLKDINCNEELPETQETLVGNALQKAEYVYKNYQYNCFADDTGLVIPALNGEPGVYSARYAGEEKNAEANMQKVLEKLKGVTSRDAYFETAIALIIDGKKHTFVGRVDGEILPQKAGAKGFGYDPIFKPNGFDISFAQMTMEEKNAISHRGRAFRKMLAFLKDF